MACVRNMDELMDLANEQINLSPDPLKAEVALIGITREQALDLAKLYSANGVGHMTVGPTYNVKRKTTLTYLLWAPTREQHDLNLGR